MADECTSCEGRGIRLADDGDGHVDEMDCDPCNGSGYASGKHPAEEAIKRVRDLHRPVEYRGMKVCVECSAYAGGSTDNPPILHPCLTVQLLDEEVGTP